MTKAITPKGDGERDGKTEETTGAKGWFSDGPLRRLFANASLLAGGRTLNGLFNLIAMTLIVRSVGLELFGLLVLIHAFASAISDLAKFQSWQAVLRYGTPAFEEGRHTDFRRLIKLTVLLDLGSGIFGVMVAVLAVPLLAPRIGLSSEWVLAVQLYSVSILFMVTATPTGLLRLFDRFDLLSVSKAMGSFIRVIGATWIFAWGGGLELLLCIWFASTVTSALWLIGHSVRALAEKDLLRGSKLGFRGLTAGHDGVASFVWMTQANTTLASGTRHLATVIVGLLLTPAAAGLFDVARRVPTLLTRFAKLMQPAIYPEFARLSVRNDLRAIRQLMLRSMILMTGAGVVIVVPLLLFGRALLGFVFGRELEVAYDLMVLLALAAAIRLLSFPLEPALISTGRAGVALLVQAASVAAFVSVIFTMVPRVGLIGSGMAMIASGLVALIGQSVAVSVWFRSRSAATKASNGPDDLRDARSMPGS